MAKVVAGRQACGGGGGGYMADRAVALFFASSTIDIHGRAFVLSWGRGGREGGGKRLSEFAACLVFEASLRL